MKAKKKRKNARILTEFFQSLKKYAMKKYENNKNGIYSFINNQIFDSLINSTSSVIKNGNVNKLFQRKEAVYKKKGEYYKSSNFFEREFSSILKEITNQISSKPIKGINNFLIGNDLSTFVESMNSNIVQTCGNVTFAKVKNKKSVFYNYYTLEPKQGKPDAKGVEVEIKACPNLLLISIYNIIKNSKFSLKNYSLKNKDGKVNSYDLKLGSSKYSKALFGVLHELNNFIGINKIDYLYNRIEQRKNNKDRILGANQVIYKHITHIRYIYELQGNSLLYSPNEIVGQNDLDYLVYNEPDTSGIYVQASSTLILDYLRKEENKISGNLYQTRTGMRIK